MSLTLPAYEYAELKLPNLRWLVDGLLFKPGIVVLQGAPFVGKSYLALQVANAVGNGGEFLGRKTAEARVLYMGLEQEYLAKARVEKLKDYIPLNFFHTHPLERPRAVNIEDKTCRDWFRGCLKDVDPALLIIDTFRQIHSRVEDSSTEMKICCDALESLVGDVALLLIHHERKEMQGFSGFRERPASKTRGSSYLPAIADSVWSLEAERDGKKGTLEIESRLGRYEWKLKREESGLWTR